MLQIRRNRVRASPARRYLRNCFIPVILTKTFKRNYYKQVVVTWIQNPGLAVESEQAPQLYSSIVQWQCLMTFDQIIWTSNYCLRFPVGLIPFSVTIFSLKP